MSRSLGACVRDEPRLKTDYLVLSFLPRPQRGAGKSPTAEVSLAYEPLGGRRLRPRLDMLRFIENMKFMLNWEAERSHALADGRRVPQNRRGHLGVLAYRFR